MKITAGTLANINNSKDYDILRDHITRIMSKRFKFILASSYSEDVIQELIMYIYKKLPEFKSEKSSLSTWVYNLINFKAHQFYNRFLRHCCPKEDMEQVPWSMGLITQNTSPSEHGKYTPLDYSRDLETTLCELYDFNANSFDELNLTPKTAEWVKIRLNNTRSFTTVPNKIRTELQAKIKPIYTEV